MSWSYWHFKGCKGTHWFPHSLPAISAESCLIKKYLVLDISNSTKPKCFEMLLIILSHTWRTLTNAGDFPLCYRCFDKYKQDKVDDKLHQNCIENLAKISKFWLSYGSHVVSYFFKDFLCYGIYACLNALWVKTSNTSLLHRILNTLCKNKHLYGL